MILPSQAQAAQPTASAENAARRAPWRPAEDHLRHHFDARFRLLLRLLGMTTRLARLPSFAGKRQTRERARTRLRASCGGRAPRTPSPPRVRSAPRSSVRPGRAGAGPGRAGSGPLRPAGSQSPPVARCPGRREVSGRFRPGACGTCTAVHNRKIRNL